MSFNALKETLRPCTTNDKLPSSSSSYFSSQISDSAIIPRKPPKSSLSQQLLRLQEVTPSLHPKREAQFDLRIESSEEEVEEEKEKGKESEIQLPRSKLESFRLFENTGNFEPLVLSPPGDIPVIQVPASINCRLLEHQRGGVKFLYNLYRNNHGGVLGDDMGLGKTIQTIAFLAAVFNKDGESGANRTDKGPVLVVCPSSVIQNWEDEFSKWSTFTVSIYHGPNRDLIIDKLEANNVEVLITSFDTYRIHGNILSEVKWDIVIIDEAHRLKNEKSKLYIACLKIKTPRRYGLTGTIMQNKIMELFNLFDWVTPGSLGTREHFREFYDEPLKHGQRSSAPERFIRVADERKQHLVSVLKRYLLRRTKEETIGHLMMGKEDNVVFCAMSELQKRVYQRTLQLPDFQTLINKDLPCSCGSPLKQVECCNRIVPNGFIWPYLHEDNPEGCDSCPYCLVLPCLVKLQQVINFLKNFEFRVQYLACVFFTPNLVQANLVQVVDVVQFGPYCKLGSSSFCVIFRSDHISRLLQIGSIIVFTGYMRPYFEAILQISNHLELIKPNPKDERSKQRKDAEFASAVFGVDIDLVGGNTLNESFMGLTDVKHCGKMRALERLMNSWISVGDKILLFSYSVRMLNILEKLIIRKGYCFSRLDGSTPTSLRQSLVDNFNSSPSKQVFLISTRAGGLGLNLVSANRVVIFDPNWNPAQDLQAQDRSFRFGQKRHVTVFRLLGAGSLEELIYTRQVYKQQLSNIAVSGKIEKRYFEGVQDCKEFRGELFGISNLFADLSDKLFTSEIIELHEKQAKQDESNHGIDLVPKNTTVKKFFVDNERGAAGEPVLENLGIVYAHRNEDIINIKAENPQKAKKSMSLNDSPSTKPYYPPMGTKKYHGEIEKGEKENMKLVSSAKRKKRSQYSLLAQSMGMEEVEFSKWLLSATPAEREKVLRDYKKRKQKIP